MTDDIPAPIYHPHGPPGSKLLPQPQKLRLSARRVLTLLDQLDRDDAGALIRNLWPSLDAQNVRLLLDHQNEVHTEPATDDALILPASWMEPRA